METTTTTTTINDKGKKFSGESSTKGLFFLVTKLLVQNALLTFDVELKK